MEALFVIFLVLALAVILTWHRISSKNADASPAYPTSHPEEQTSRSHSRIATPISEPGTPIAFERKNSVHIHEKRILAGSAWVTDGDTIKIEKTQIRLFGIDAPELDHPYGRKAKWELHKLCKGNKIRAENTDKDEYGRTVARCYLPDGRDLSAEMVKLGMAIDWPKFSGGLYKKHEVSGVRKQLYLADARQKGRIHIWKKFEERKKPSDQ